MQQCSLFPRLRLLLPLLLLLFLSACGLPEKTAGPTVPTKAIPMSDPSDEADATLLSLEIGVTEAQMEAASPLERVEIDLRTYSEPGPQYWVLATCEADNTLVKVERANKKSRLWDQANIEGCFLPGETSYSGRLNKGDVIAVHTTLPWHTEVRIAAQNGDLFGHYDFGSENSLHLEDASGRMPTRYVEGALTPGVNYQSAEELKTFLNGTWVYLDPDTAEPVALLRFDAEEGTVYASTNDRELIMTFDFDRLYAAPDAPPDLLTLAPHALTPEAFTFELFGVGQLSGSFGDYLISGVQTAGEELLYLRQANNGEAALTRLMPSRYRENMMREFTLHRWEGATAAVSAHSGETFPGYVWKYDRENYCLWVTDATFYELTDWGDPVYVLNDYVARPYFIRSSEAILSLRGSLDAAYPQQFFNITVDASGSVTLLESLTAPVIPDVVNPQEQGQIISSADDPDYREFLGGWRFWGAPADSPYPQPPEGDPLFDAYLTFHNEGFADYWENTGTEEEYHLLQKYHNPEDGTVTITAACDTNSNQLTCWRVGEDMAVMRILNEEASGGEAPYWVGYFAYIPSTGAH